MKELSIIFSIIGVIFIIVGFVVINNANPYYYSYFRGYAQAMIWMMFGLFFLNLAFISILYHHHLNTKNENPKD